MCYVVETASRVLIREMSSIRSVVYNEVHCTMHLGPLYIACEFDRFNPSPLYGGHPWMC